MYRFSEYQNIDTQPTLLFYILIAFNFVKIHMTISDQINGPINVPLFIGCNYSGV